MESLRVLITGGADFIGSNLIKALVRADIERLILLERGFEVVAEEFFLSYRLGRRVVWVRISRGFAGKVLTRPEAPGLVCLVLRKPLS